MIDKSIGDFVSAQRTAFWQLLERQAAWGHQQLRALFEESVSEALIKLDVNARRAERGEHTHESSR